MRNIVVDNASFSPKCLGGVSDKVLLYYRKLQLHLSAIAFRIYSISRLSVAKYCFTNTGHSSARLFTFVDVC